MAAIASFMTPWIDTLSTCRKMSDKRNNKSWIAKNSSFSEVVCMLFSLFSAAAMATLLRYDVRWNISVWYPDCTGPCFLSFVLHNHSKPWPFSTIVTFDGNGCFFWSCFCSFWVSVPSLLGSDEYDEILVDTVSWICCGYAANIFFLNSLSLDMLTRVASCCIMLFVTMFLLFPSSNCHEQCQRSRVGYHPSLKTTAERPTIWCLGLAVVQVCVSSWKHLYLLG